MSDIKEICQSLIMLQIDRKFVINLEIKQMNTAAARMVSAIGLTYGEGGDDEDTKEKVWSRAKRVVSAAISGKAQKPDDREIGQLQERNLAMLAKALQPIKERRKEIEREMERLAGELPVATFVKHVPGFDMKGLSVIIGEAGDLSNYATKRKLWRRLGYGMAPGHEEKAYSTWRKEGGLTSEEWKVAGYSPKRLGQIYGVVTIPLFLHKGKSKYGKVYDRRRKQTLQTHPDWYVDKNGEKKVDPKSGEPSSEHAKMDAQRVMTKALLADLLAEWKKSIAGVSVTPLLASLSPVAA